MAQHGDCGEQRGDRPQIVYVLLCTGSRLPVGVLAEGRRDLFASFHSCHKLRRGGLCGRIRYGP
ncbi:MAG: hypothetical protein ACREFP_00875 [Acetobacteraceae bacterium]